MFNLVINLLNLFYVLGNQFVIIRKKRRDKEEKEKRSSKKKREKRIEREYSFLIPFLGSKTYSLSFTKKIKPLFLLEERRQ